MEMLLGIVAMVTLGVSVVGWLWIVVTAFSDGDTLWGIGGLIISPLALVTAS